MKKIVAIIIVAFLLIMMISGCGKGVSGTDSDAKAFKIGYLGWDMGQAWNIATYEGLKWGADMMGCEIIQMDAKGDAETQVSQAEQLINQGVDVIAMFPVASDSGATVVRMANEAGIPISIENTFLDDNAGEMIGQVACLYNDIGYAAVKWASENVDNAKLLYVSGAYGLGVTEIYEEGVQQAIEDFSDSIELAGQITDEDWTIEGAYDVTAGFIQGGHEFNVIFAQDDAVAKGVYQALNDAGLSDIPVISTGGSADGYLALTKGETAANMTAPANLQGLIQFGRIWAHMNGEEWGEVKMALPIVPIDSNNVDDWLDWDDMEAGYDYVKSVFGEYTPSK